MDGILLVNKETGMTSRDVVNIVSSLLQTKKVGHTGTLDPLATGVLVVCIGKSTKFVEILTSYEKEYEATIVLGMITDTLDITGNILEQTNIIKTKEEIEHTLKEMTKTYMQEVPLYSAVKKNGKKLYEYARTGQYVELPKKEVTIKSLELVSDIRYENGKTIFKIRCIVSKGTYIRSLIKDIAESLNTIGIMSSLTRIKQGDYRIEDCYTLDDIKNNNYKFIDENTILNKYDSILLEDEEMIKHINNGAIVDNIYNSDIILFKDSNDNIALYKKYEKNESKMKPWKMLK